jgi:hypothetical protein
MAHKAGRPNNNCWELWEKALTQCFIKVDNRHERTRRPLGAWLKNPDNWKWFLAQDQDVLLEHLGYTNWKK